VSYTKLSSDFATKPAEIHREAQDFKRNDLKKKVTLKII